MTRAQWVLGVGCLTFGLDLAGFGFGGWLMGISVAIFTFHLPRKP